MKMEALGTMKKLLLLILLTGAFLGGYHLGRQPNSPDIFAWAQKTYNQAVDAGHQLSAAVNDDSGSMLQAVAAEEIEVTADGKRYVIGRRQQPADEHRR